MLYYVGKGSTFDKKGCREYKTLKGALAAAEKDEELFVWDEDGKPAGKLAQATAEIEAAAEVPAEAPAAAAEEPAAPEAENAPQEEEAAADPQKDTADKAIFYVKTIPDKLNIRLNADPFSLVVGIIDEKESKKKEHGIMDIRDGWGKLAEFPFGWIQLSLVRLIRKG